ncbi:MAG: hypothetical protein K2G89_05210 [Lachnospiraceae bacterium]|nr:hypothetical protein [Lachnospiraceae bacterium]
MKQEISYINPTSLDISVADFDAMDEIHVFSKEYKRNKKQMLKQYRKKIYTSGQKNYIKAAMIAALFLILAPIAVNAATDGEFFNRIWGKLAKKDVKSHDEVLYDEQNFPYTYTFPEREYVDVDPDKANALIGEHVSHHTIVKELGDTTLTILSSVYDGNSAIVAFTLKREGGVNALQYSQLDNEGYGARFTHDATFRLEFTGYSETIFVDLDRSTNDLLYCYDYMVTTNSSAMDMKELSLEVKEYPCTVGEMFAADEETFDKYLADTKTSHISIPLKPAVKRSDYTNAAGGIASISSIGLKIDIRTGLGLSGDEIYDRENIYYIAVNYKDGTDYVVLEHALPSVHDCDVKKDNSNAFDCYEGIFTLLFNRLVDTDTVQSITVNDTTYSLK